MRNDEQHEEMLDLVGGTVDPEEFDPALGEKRIKKGLPDWRSGRWV
jgi:hypothetical protein